ncbi:sigma-70 family RNA polymerase sigma factor [Brevibacillus sp. SYP-B805]|uniref:RNA polymerase sigma factor n=1 Tax=Brevibacillus sp. SYP-B805 TaxID=1578199 RepID=UPI0013ECC135|nr:sigma-70 family RNA polymerase sigma factor [Brevibacillus sp. SYP-B805]NGQ95982.1 sigma-70 family RNA polymerase sigma factor [Brevibacillus sp. SYP-B805]
MSCPTTYDQLYRRYYPNMTRYFRRRTNSPWDAEDLTATVFTKALSRLEQYNSQYPFGSWLYAIARNTLTDYLRKKRDLPAEAEWFHASLADEDANPEETLLKNEEFDAVWQQARTLTPDQYQVLSLRYRAEMSMKEIARKIGKPESTVKVIHHRALKQLRKRLKKHA